MQKTLLEQELNRMFEDNKDFTPIAAFNNFLSSVSDDDTKLIFKGLFDYQQQKVNEARSAFNSVLAQGGSIQDARNAYHEAAAKIPRMEMIEIVKDLNIEVGFSNSNVQEQFDQTGKLPRFEDAQVSTSFVDLTAVSEKTNSSANNNNTDVESDTSSASNDLIQKLLDEIKVLKNRINELESDRNTSTTQQVVLETRNFDDLYFADWISATFQEMDI